MRRANDCPPSCAVEFHQSRKIFVPRTAASQRSGSIASLVADAALPAVGLFLSSSEVYWMATDGEEADLAQVGLT
jgi:hypothetical protein